MKKVVTLFCFFCVVTFGFAQCEGDVTPPTITCPPDWPPIIVEAEFGSCYGYASIPVPVVADDCGVFSLTNSFNELEDASGYYPVTAGFGIQWIATDSAGNSSSCILGISIVDNVLPTITCPENITAYLAPESCVANLEVEVPAAADNCGIATIENSFNNWNDASDEYPVGLNEVIWTVTDISGNVATCSQVINVFDTIAPVITQCAPDVVMNYNNSCQGVTLDWTSFVEATDNCDSNLNIAQWPVVGTVITGQTTITITVIDDSGNFSTCSFTVTLIDNTSPEIVNCPTNQTLVLDANCEAELPNYLSEIEVNDNCTFLNTVTQNPAPGIVITENTVVTIAATDDSGNTTLCQFEVITQPSSAQAMAQEDFDTCNPTNAITANEPPAGYTGLWTFVQGSGSFDDPTTASTNVTFDGTGAIILQWTITGSDEGCGVPSSSDVVLVMYYTASCEQANAGPDMELCNATSTELSGSPVEFPAIGEWSQMAGPSMVVFSNVNDPNATVANLVQGPYVFFWTIPASECCPETFDEVSIFNFNAPVPAAYSAGDDIELCSPESGVQLSADPPMLPFIGVWTVVSGGGVFTDVNAYNTSVFDIPIGENVYSWTLYDQLCGTTYYDTVLVTVLEFCPPISGDLDGDGEISMEEFNEIIGAFGCVGDECTQYDMDGDGIVGMNDLLILIANMGG